MKYTASEKIEIIHIVTDSKLSVKTSLEKLDIARSTFYEWVHRYQEGGYENLCNKKKKQNTVWNKVTDEERKKTIEFAKENSELSCREIAFKVTDKMGFFISESSVYRILKSLGLVRQIEYEINSAKDEFENKTTHINQLWQTDFTYFKIVDWGWYYLSTVLDDYSRRILAWKLCESMESQDAKETISLAIKETGILKLPEINRPTALSDNGPSYRAKSFEDFIHEMGMTFTRGRPYHPQTQGKIERYHQSMKNKLLLNIYTSPKELELAISQWVDYYNNERYHESIGNVTPNQKYFGKQEAIQKKRERLKRKTIQARIEYNKLKQTKKIG